MDEFLESIHFNNSEILFFQKFSFLWWFISRVVDFCLK